jgi:DAK2 domain fusion protein YloV
MGPRTHLDAADLRAVMAGFADALRAHRAALNQLNVYPVPDGDTGTNMALTLESVVADMAGVDDSMPEVCRALAHGSLMGARGNSGVILSQVVRGLSDVFASAGTVDGPVLARALDAAATAAYGAVLRPVEGTILTVVRECAARAAAAAAGGDASLLAVAEAAREGAADALASTPDLLPVLRDAGVVDAGGSGFLLLCDALLHVIDGRPVPEPAVVADTDFAAVAAGRRPSVADLRYEVMFFLHADDERVPAFKDAWLAIGDSIVVVGGNGLYNCHIHTDDIGAAVEAGIEAGRPSKIRVTDLLEEVEEQQWVRDAAVPPAAVAEHVTTAVVSVGVGDGVVRMLRSLGAHEVVSGGQSMNPSTADLVEAIRRVDAGGVVVLPNNKNIVPVALAAAGQVDVPVHVVPTRSVAEGLAALVAYDPEAPADENHAAMQAAAAAVVSGEVTRAVRDAQTAAGPVREGDHIGVGPDGVVAVADTVVGAATGLLATMLTDEHEILTVLAGAEATEADTAAICAWLESEHPDIEVEVHSGGQPLYAYEFGVE